MSLSTYTPFYIQSRSTGGYLGTTRLGGFGERYVALSASETPRWQLESLTGSTQPEPVALGARYRLRLLGTKWHLHHGHTAMAEFNDKLGATGARDVVFLTRAPGGNFYYINSPHHQQVLSTSAPAPPPEPPIGPLLATPAEGAGEGFTYWRGRVGQTTGYDVDWALIPSDAEAEQAGDRARTGVTVVLGRQQQQHASSWWERNKEVFLVVLVAVGLMAAAVAVYKHFVSK